MSNEQKYDMEVTPERKNAIWEALIRQLEDQNNCKYKAVIVHKEEPA